MDYDLGIAKLSSSLKFHRNLTELALLLFFTTHPWESTKPNLDSAWNRQIFMLSCQQFGIGIRTWNSDLDLGLAIRTWYSDLEFRLEIWTWNSGLEFGLGIRTWNLDLEFGLGIRTCNSDKHKILPQPNSTQPKVG